MHLNYTTWHGTVNTAAQIPASARSRNYEEVAIEEFFVRITVNTTFCFFYSFFWIWCSLFIVFQMLTSCWFKMFTFTECLLSLQWWRHWVVKKVFYLQHIFCLRTCIILRISSLCITLSINWKFQLRSNLCFIYKILQKKSIPTTKKHQNNHFI